MKLSYKLPLAITCTALLTGGVVGTTSIASLSHNAREAADVQFQSNTNARKEQVKQFLESVVGNVHALTDNPTTFAAMQEFHQAWNQLGSGQTETLQRAYIQNNSNPAGKKNELMTANDGSTYSAAHKKFHPWLNEFLQEMGLYDIFLISPEGDIIYTVFKEPDFATNVKDGAWKDTGIGKLYHRAMALPAGSEDVVYVDFAPYAPSNNAPAAFIGRPVFDDAGQRLGVLAFQMPIGKINDIIKDEKGMGKTGEVSIYGSDMLMRNDSRFEKESTILKRSNATDQVKQALEGKSGVIEGAVNHAGKPVLAAYEPLEFAGAKYALIGEIERDEVDAPILAERNKTLGIVLGIIACVSVLGFFAARLVSRKVNQLSEAASKLSHGDTQMNLDSLKSKDEIGDMAVAMEQLQKSVADNVRLKMALDGATSNMMMADQNFNIIYLNQSVTKMLKDAEKDIQKELPRFEVDKLMGVNIDIFHKNPAHQRGMLEKLNSQYKTSIQVGGRSFNLVANPIFGQNNQRLGTVVEWLDGAAAGMVDAINKSQAVIEFMTDGTIMNANANFLGAMGYTLDEIVGKHHSMFVDPAYKASTEYKQFWEALNRGEPQSGEFKRFGKGGKEIWINAAYNPIADLRGKIVRVVKTAADVTQMVTTRIENEKGMNEAVKVLTGLSQGNLTQKMELEYLGTFGQIKEAVNATVDRLYDMVRRIIEAAQAVNSASGEIASGSTDLSQRTEEQASSLEETAASMEELTGTVRQNSENAKNANELSTQANRVATDGGRVVEDAVSAMGTIEKSSQKISDIIGVIDEIAFQTNLLALNAAVEAARAGEAGKGFAVVAAEVRSLAGRSASASKEIKTLINESASQVQTGAELVNHAGATLKDIVGSVQKVAGIVSDIAAASQEQATGIDEINTAVTQMDETTQQNAALVEQNTAAAQSMVEQAQELERLMKFFTLSAEMATEAEAITESAAQVITPTFATQRSKPVSKPAGKTVAKPKKVASMKAAKGGHASGDGWEEF